MARAADAAVVAAVVALSRVRHEKRDGVAPQARAAPTYDRHDGPPSGVLEAFLDRVDRVQRCIVPVAFAVGVIKKFGEDRARKLAALVAYYSFFSVFPLLLALVTLLGFVLDGRPELRQRIVDSAIGQIPVLGDQIERGVGSLTGDAFALAVGVGAALWAGLGAMLAGEDAMNEIWDVPHDDRPNPVVVRLRALAMLGILGVGLVGAVVANNLTELPLGIPGQTRLFIYAGNLVLDVCIVGLAYQVLTDRSLTRREIVPGAVVAGAGYFSVQLLGSWFVQRAVNGATETYGTFAVVIGLLTWFHLLAQITLLGAEVNVVASRRLWPRSLSGRHLTDADITAFRRYVDAARRLEEAGPGSHAARKRGRPSVTHVTVRSRPAGGASTFATPSAGRDSGTRRAAIVGADSTHRQHGTGTGALYTCSDTRSGSTMTPDLPGVELSSTSAAIARRVVARQWSLPPRPASPGDEGAERLAFVRSLAEALAACEDVRLLHDLRDQLVELARTDGNALMEPVRAATRSCRPGCSVRDFWAGVARDSAGAPLHP